MVQLILKQWPLSSLNNRQAKPLKLCTKNLTARIMGDQIRKSQKLNLPKRAPRTVNVQ